MVNSFILKGGFEGDHPVRAMIFMNSEECLEDKKADFDKRIGHDKHGTKVVNISPHICKCLTMYVESAAKSDWVRIFYLAFGGVVYEREQGGEKRKRKEKNVTSKKFIFSRCKSFTTYENSHRSNDFQADLDFMRQKYDLQTLSPKPILLLQVIINKKY